MEKLIFTVFCFSSPLPPKFNVGFEFLDLLTEPWTNPSNTELEGGGEGLFLTRRRGRWDIFRVWKNGLISYKPISSWWKEPTLCCESIKSDKRAHKVSYIVSVDWGFSKTLFGEDCRLQILLCIWQIYSGIWSNCESTTV